MTVPARRVRASLADSEDDFDEGFAAREFYSGERVCPPPERFGGIGFWRGAILIALALGGGWAVWRDPATFKGWLAAGIAAVSAAVDAGAPAPVGPTSAAVVAPPLPTTTIAPSPPIAAVEPPPPHPPAETQSAATEQPETTGSVESATEPAAAAPPAEPLPPPVVDALDPYQKRAAAVGLHPQLSRALLQRLSPTDYRNAGVAIETAVAKTADTATFVWPRQRTPELALFQVHFVPGAAPHCRRYVVTVTKDRWSTTAPPMEKCGTKLAGGKGK